MVHDGSTMGRRRSSRPMANLLVTGRSNRYNRPKLLRSLRRWGGELCRICGVQRGRNAVRPSHFAKQGTMARPSGNLSPKVIAQGNPMMKGYLDVLVSQGLWKGRFCFGSVQRPRRMAYTRSPGMFGTATRLSATVGQNIFGQPRLDCASGMGGFVESPG